MSLRILAFFVVYANLLFIHSKYDHLLPRPLDIFAGRDLHEVEVEAHERSAQRRKKPVLPGVGTTLGSGPEPPSASSLTAVVDDPSSTGARSPPPPVSVVIGEDGSAVISEAPPPSGDQVPNGITSTPTSPKVNGTSHIERSPASSLVEELAKKVSEENEVQGAPQDVDVKLPKFKHVPGVGMIPETPTTPESTATGANSTDAAASDVNASKTGDPQVVEVFEDSVAPKPEAAVLTNGDFKPSTESETNGEVSESNNEAPAAESEYASAASSPRAGVDVSLLSGGLAGGTINEMKEGVTAILQIDIVRSHASTTSDSSK